MTEPSDDLGPTDRELLRRAELALTQLNNRHGLEPDQSATLTAIRLRLEGKSRASLDDLLVAGKDLGGKDPLSRGHDPPPAGAQLRRPGRRGRAEAQEVPGRPALRASNPSLDKPVQRLHGGLDSGGCRRTLPEVPR